MLNGISSRVPATVPQHCHCSWGYLECLQAVAGLYLVTGQLQSWAADFVGNRLVYLGNLSLCQCRYICAIASKHRCSSSRWTIYVVYMW